MLNDYDFMKDPAKAGDTRWIHRPKMQWEFLDELDDHIQSGSGSIRARIFQSMQRLIALRKDMPALAGQEMQLISTGNDHVLGYRRASNGNSLVVLGNFSEHEQKIDGNRLRTATLGRFFEDHISGETIPTSEPLVMSPYQLLWLSRA